MPAKNITTKDYLRFDSYVEKTESCWLWTGTKFSHGYGCMYLCGKSVRAHRFAYEREYGPIPTGLLVRHRCDVKLCVRPSHLVSGTNDENMADMVARNRQNSKLCKADVLDMRASSLSQADLARKYGLSPSHVSEIINRKYWKHI